MAHQSVAPVFLLLGTRDSRQTGSLFGSSGWATNTWLWCRSTCPFVFLLPVAIKHTGTKNKALQLTAMTRDRIGATINYRWWGFANWVKCPSIRQCNAMEEALNRAFRSYRSIGELRAMARTNDIQFLFWTFLMYITHFISLTAFADGVILFY